MRWGSFFVAKIWGFVNIRVIHNHILYMPKSKSKKSVAKKMRPVSLKKKAKKPAKLVIKAGKPAGKVVHYYDHIKVAVIKLSAPLAVGDEIRIMGGESTDFNQSVASMQMDHEKIKKAQKGKAIGLKVKEKVREGYKVFKV